MGVTKHCLKYMSLLWNIVLVTGRFGRIDMSVNRTSSVSSRKMKGSKDTSFVLYKSVYAVISVSELSCVMGFFNISHRNILTNLWTLPHKQKSGLFLGFVTFHTKYTLALFLLQL